MDLTSKTVCIQLQTRITFCKKNHRPNNGHASWLKMTIHYSKDNA